jgi:ornithine carbamoyltransferase
MTTTLTLPVAVTKDLLTGAEWSPADARELLQRTADIKARPLKYASTLRGKHIALIFEKPSLRTRVTFEVGIQSMGGFVVFLDHTQARLGERESIPDVARNLERWVQGIVARVYEQRVLDEMAATTEIPIVNALSDKFHPCQALADYFTLQEKFGNLKKITLAYVGDGNNVLHSLLLTAALLGSKIRVGTPKGYGPNPQILADAHEIAKTTGASIELMTDPHKAVRGVDAIYTDAWTSMGHEPESEERTRIFPPYQVNCELMAEAAPHAVFMHCLPAHRNEEVTDAVIDSLQSIVFDQAENRMHVQKAILMMLAGGKNRLPVRSAHA